MSSLDTVPDAETAKEIALTAPMRTYRVPAVVLHWVTAALVFFMIASGVIAKQLGEGDLANTLMSLHKLTGAATLALIVLRIVYRAFSSAAEWGARLQRRPVLHWGLYVVVIIVPLLGWAGISDFGAREVAFGIVLPPIWPEGAGYDEILLRVHAYAAFALLALVALHVGIAIQDTMTAGRPGGPTHGE
jgi:cytochrome b561